MSLDFKMAASDYNMDVETQRRVEYTRQKLVRIEQMNEQLRKLTKANRGSEEKMERLIKRKESLELDIARLADASMRAEPEVGVDLLHSIEEPMDMDVIYGEAFRKKMCHLKVLLNEIIVRTSFNEKAMCQEIGHQEAEFENRLKDAIHGRTVVIRKTEEAQKKCEMLAQEQADVYEDVRELEGNIEKFDAARWLLNVEKRRVSDMLDRTKREPKTGIDCRKPYIVPPESCSMEELVSSTSSLTHDHFAPKHTYEDLAENANVSLKDNLVEMARNEESIKHKKGCPKNNNNNQKKKKKTTMLAQMVPIPHSDSVISALDAKTKKCPVHHGKEAGSSTSTQLPINGINLMELISKAIEDELASL